MAATPSPSISTVSSTSSGDSPITVTVYQTDHPVSTVSGSVVSIPTSYGTQTATDTMPLSPLLNGSCTTPFFADVSNAGGVVIRYPQVGCAPQQQNCCPYAFQDRVLLTACPPDYSSVARGTYSACCPS